MKPLYVLCIVSLLLAILLQTSAFPMNQKISFTSETDCAKCSSITTCLMCLNSKIVFESKPTPPAPKETTSPPSTISKTPDDFVSLTERLIHESINTQRASYGLPELELNSQLSTAARLHSQDMAKYNYFSHTSRDGRNFSTRISEQGLSCSASAENIAMNSGFDEYSTAQSAVEGWMNSKDHRENILKGYSVEGIGVAVAKDGSVYVTEDFC